jgi:hypothetical protein
MTTGERKAYARGYQVAGHKWPAHKPPTPPDPVVAELVEAMREMRDTCDAFRSTLCKDDEFGQSLELVIDRADAALTAVTRWLRA